MALPVALSEVLCGEALWQQREQPARFLDMVYHLGVLLHSIAGQGIFPRHRW